MSMLWRIDHCVSHAMTKEKIHYSTTDEFDSDLPNLESVEMVEENIQNSNLQLFA